MHCFYTSTLYLHALIHSTHSTEGLRVAFIFEKYIRPQYWVWREFQLVPRTCFGLFYWICLGIRPLGAPVGRFMPGYSVTLKPCVDYLDEKDRHLSTSFCQASEQMWI
jgi:hypothetical protein